MNEGFSHAMLHMWVASCETLTSGLKNNTIVNLQGWVLLLEVFVCDTAQQQKIQMSNNQYLDLGH